MPYYLFKMKAADELGLVKQLELLERFEVFRDAKKAAKKLRAVQQGDEFTFKVMFAESQLSAEEQLLEKREPPVLMEHER